MHRSPPLIASVSLALMLFSQTTQSLPAQSAAPGPEPSATAAPALRSVSRNVILDIVVTDASGRPVHGLTAADLIVRENTRPQHFQLIGAPSGEPDSSPAATPASPLAGASDQPAGRTRNIVLLDEMNVSFLDLAYARKRLLLFLQSPAARHQNMALMALTASRTVLIHDFTDNNADLADALKHLPAAMPSAADSSTFVDPERAQDDLIKSLAVVEDIAHALSFSPAHTNLFWITSGFPTLSPIVSSGDVQSTFDQLMRHASNLYLNARMTTYTIDSSGVQWIDSLPNHTQPNATGNGSGSSGFLRSSGGGGNTGDQFYAQTNNIASNRAAAGGLLGAMDARTGGRAFSNSNDIDAPLAEALTEGNSFYTVAYTPSDRNFNGAFRHISVQVNRPGLVARTREGYYALADPDATTAATRRVRFASALDSPLLFRGLTVSATLETVAGRPSLRVHLSEPGVEWTYSNGQSHAAHTIVVAAYAKNSHPMVSHAWSVGSNRAGTGHGQDLIYVLPFDPPAGATHLRLLVAADPGSRIGTCDVLLTAAPSDPAAAHHGS